MIQGVTGPSAVPTSSALCGSVGIRFYMECENRRRVARVAHRPVASPPASCLVGRVQAGMRHGRHCPFALLFGHVCAVSGGFTLTPPNRAFAGYLLPSVTAAGALASFLPGSLPGRRRSSPVNSFRTNAALPVTVSAPAARPMGPASLTTSFATPTALAPWCHRRMPPSHVQFVYMHTREPAVTDHPRPVLISHADPHLVTALRDALHGLRQ
jgi:hypothetical protein